MSADHPPPLDAFTALVRRRAMVRTYTDVVVPAALVNSLLDLARRAPSAGNTQAISFLVLDDADGVAAYWAVTMSDPDARARFRWQGLLRAPVLVIPYVDPGAYVARYAEPDKARTGLGTDSSAWPVPYWFIDGGAAVEHLLLGATAAGLGACLFGQFHHEAAVRTAFEVPDHLRSLGTVSVGWPAIDEHGRSAGRPRPDLASVVHRGRWAR